MADAGVEDLLSLDRDVARGWRALDLWRASVLRDPEKHAQDQPLEPVRRAAGKSTWEALGRLSPSAADVPLRDALRPWVFVLTLGRIAQADEVAVARAMSEPRGRAAGDPALPESWREAWRDAVAARSVAEAQQSLDAAAELGPHLADVTRRRSERRVELAHRLGGAHPWQPIAPVPPGVLRNAARRLLDATEDAALSLRREAPDDDVGAAAAIHAAVARDAGQGWPARLGTAWLQDAFGGALGGMRPELAPLPEALGASSFARALYAFGYAAGSAPRSAVPFALAHEPGMRAAHRLGFVCGALPADVSWQMRVLGVGRRTAHAQARALARTALLDARLHAARVLLGDPASPAPRDIFDELGPRLFGKALDPRLCGAWPAARDDEPGRFVALAESRRLADTLRERFDADWFRNPRAWAHLRVASTSPDREPVDEAALAAGIDQLGQAFEGALG